MSGTLPATARLLMLVSQETLHVQEKGRRTVAAAGPWALEAASALLAGAGLPGGDGGFAGVLGAAVAAGPCARDTALGPSAGAGAPGSEVVLDFVDPLGAAAVSGAAPPEGPAAASLRATSMVSAAICAVRASKETVWAAHPERRGLACSNPYSHDSMAVHCVIIIMESAGVTILERSPLSVRVHPSTLGYSSRDTWQTIRRICFTSLQSLTC